MASTELTGGIGMTEIILAKFSKKMKAAPNSNNVHIARKILTEVMVHQAMIECQGNATKASEKLGMTRSMLSKYLGTSVFKWRFKEGK